MAWSSLAEERGTTKRMPDNSARGQLGPRQVGP